MRISDWSSDVCSSALAAKALEPGSLVTLVSDHGEGFGTAMFNPRSLIAARRLDPAADAAIDADFLAARIGRALALRERLYDAPFYRLVHTEADGLPGLVIDRFDDALVLQLNTDRKSTRLNSSH